MIHAACSEMVNSANLSFALCPLLTDGAIEALLTAGTPEQQAAYIPKMIDGAWTGSMNLTEPQAGSDLSVVRTRAEPQPDGSYKLFGTKIFITYGEHDMAENIVHLVLARVVGAPEGVKGISLFICPKFLVNADGSLGARNDVHCVSIEHKLGIKASPTAVLQYGDHGGAVAYLVGQENRGLEYMFIMMNAARFGVGVQGIALAERAYQKAVAYARDRVQSRPVDGSMQAPGAIIHHPDVRRMLMTMRAHTEGCRAMALVAAAAYDAAHAHPDAEVRKQNQAFYEFMVPLIKGLPHRDEPGRGQPGRAGARRHGLHRGDRRRAVPARRQDPDHLRRHDGDPGQRPGRPQDGARRRRGGARHRRRRSRPPKASCARAAAPPAARWHERLSAARRAFLDVVDFVAGQTKASPNAVFAGSVPYLMLAGTVMAGWQMARALMVAEDRLAEGTDAAFMQAKIATARFYADHILNKARGPARQHRRRRRVRHRHAPGGLLMALPAALKSACRCRSSARRCSSSATRKLVIAQCKAGVVGSMPALNARPASQLDEWLAEITETLAAWDRDHPGQPGGALCHQPDRAQEQRPARARHGGVRQVQGADRHHLAGRAHRRQRGRARLGRRGAARHHQQRLRAQGDREGRRRPDRGGGRCRRPRRREEPVRAGAGDPRVVRRAAGAVAAPSPPATRVLAALAMGADFAYIGSAFIATDEARASDAYKQCIVDSNSDDIVYSSLFTGVHGNYLKPSIRAAGLDPDHLPESDPSKMDFGGGEGAKKAWKDIWGCGQGIGAVKAVVPVAERVAQLRAELGVACRRLAAMESLKRLDGLG